MSKIGEFEIKNIKDWVNGNKMIVPPPKLQTI